MHAIYIPPNRPSHPPNSRRRRAALLRLLAVVVIDAVIDAVI